MFLFMVAIQWPADGAAWVVPAALVMGLVLLLLAWAAPD
jgi:hypothetical protein